MLDPVYAVELEPGRYAKDQPRVMRPSRHPWVFNMGGDAWDVRDLYRKNGYPDARLVKFKLVEVRDGDDE